MNDKKSSLKITDDLITYLADLSLLSFEKNEKEKMKNDLEKLVVFCNKVESCPLERNNNDTDIKNSFTTPTRKKDKITYFSKETALSNAALKNEDFFLVPKIIEK